MTTTNQTSTSTKAQDQAIKAKTAGRGKATLRKTASPARRTARTASRRRSSHPSVFEGYGDSAARLIARGRSMLGDAYTWAGEAGSALPRTARQLNLPDQKSLRTLIDEKPLILGAVGLGIGVVLGAMLPSVRRVGNFVSGQNGKRPAARKSRRK